MILAIKNLMERTVYRGGSPYYYLRKLAEIAGTSKTYRRRREVGSDLASKLTPADRSVVANLRANGFTTLLSPLQLTEELVAASKARLSKYLAEVGQPVTNMGINFMSSLLTEKDLGPDSIFVRYAAQERLLAMASDYLGEAPYLSNIVLIYSFETSETPSATQFWHKDYDDTKMFKIFIYCSDVDVPEDGALHVANRQAMKGIYASPLYSSRRFGDDQFFKMVDRSQATALCGPAGTTFICDTHQSFHYGSRCTRRPRLACFITYQHYAGLYPAGRVADPPPTAPDEMKLLLAKTPA